MSRIPAPIPIPSQQEPLSYETPQAETAVSIGSIAVKLLGVYCIVLTLPVVSYIGMIFQRGYRVPGNLGWVALAFSPYIVYAAAAVALIRGGDRIALWLFSGGPMIAPLRTTSGAYWQALALSIVGVMTVLHAFPNVVGELIVRSRYSNTDAGNRVIAPVLELAMGVGLFFGSRGLALLWHKLRTAGTPRDET